MKHTRKNTYVERELRRRRAAKIRDIFNQILEFLGMVVFVAFAEAVIIYAALAWC